MTRLLRRVRVWGARRLLASVAGLALLSPLLASCGGSAGASSGPVVLNFYNFPDPSGAVQTAANDCSARSHGRYRIIYQKLPTSADGQREQLVRRLAAHDDTMDILGLDVTWEAEFAEAHWIVPWTGRYKQEAERGTLPGPLKTAIWKGQLVAVPYNSNTQLLWYRNDLVPHPPRTWAQMLQVAEHLARQGKPHYIEIQGAQYEGITVWFNTLVASAGGSILNASSTAPRLGRPALKALQIMADLAHSPAADPSLANQQEDQNRLAMEAGTAAFELNYPFVYPSMKADKPQLFKHFKWTLYPRVDPSRLAAVTIGGIDLAISAYSRHRSLAFQAALCLRDRHNQLLAAVEGGLPPTLESIYAHPTKSFVAEYPFYKEIAYELRTASVRPKTPAYQNVSIVISHLLSPPSGIRPRQTLQAMRAQLVNALQDKGLIP